MKIKIISLIAAIILIVAACGGTKSCPAYSKATSEVNSETNS